MPNNKKKPIGSKNFLNQIKNLNKQGKKPKLIRKILKLSYHKNMVPSINVINFKNIKNLICPFLGAKYNFECILHQDNDPKHSSRLIRSFLNLNEVNWL